MTIRTYSELNALIKKYGGTKKCSLKILAFPCNQFGKQEPSSNEELLNTLKYVRPGNGFEPHFDLFQKLEVNGNKESNLFRYLKKVCPRPNDVISKTNDILWSPIKVSDIQWNFEKIIIDHNGVPIRRYSEMTYPLTLDNDVKKATEKCVSDGIVYDINAKLEDQLFQ